MFYFQKESCASFFYAIFILHYFGILVSSSLYRSLLRLASKPAPTSWTGSPSLLLVILQPALYPSITIDYLKLIKYLLIDGVVKGLLTQDTLDIEKLSRRIRSLPPLVLLRLRYFRNLKVVIRKKL